MSFLQNLLNLLLEAAPWLVLGLALGGLMKALIPTAFLHKHLSGQGLGAIMKAALLGAPLPLCSCGVIPAALGLRKAGASKPATASFLVSTPETGIDSISITYALLGPFMAVVRPVAALASALVAGGLVALFDRETPTPLKSAEASAETSCCATSASGGSCCGTPAPVSILPVINQPLKEVAACCGTAEPVATASSCCGSDASSSTGTSCCGTSNEPPPQTWMGKAWGGVYYAFTQMLDDIVLWLLVGLLFAALVQTFLPPDFLAQWGSGIVAMLVMMLAGIPMYICATASTPVAAGLLLAGVSPGVALVLLLTGPATNISTLGVIRQELGQRSMWLYLLGVCATALLAGLLADALVQAWGIDIAAGVHAGHDSIPGWLQWLALLLLVAAAGRKWLGWQAR